MTQVFIFDFVLNKADEDSDESFEAKHTKFREFLKTNCKKWLYQLERGKETNRLHYQGYMNLNAKTYEGTLKKTLSQLGCGVRISIASNEGKAALKSYVLKQDTRVGKQYSDKCPDGAEEVKEDGEEKYVYDIELRPWQKYIYLYAKHNRNDREILWIKDPVGGRGKSAIIKYLVSRGLAVPITAAKAADILHVATKYKSKCYIVNLTRTRGGSVDDDELYQAIENIKDGLWLSPKYDSDIVCRDWATVIVMANEPPKVNKMTYDRWNILTLTDDYPNNMQDVLCYQTFNEEGNFWRTEEVIAPGIPMVERVTSKKRKRFTLDELEALE